MGYSMPGEPVGYSTPGGIPGYCNNISFGVVAADVPPEVFSNSSTETLLDESEPQLHHWGDDPTSGGEMKGLFGVSEYLDVYRGFRTEDDCRTTQRSDSITSGESVGVLVNMDV